ncbi:thyroglobulin [Carettochelys insculpta]|uniref:thyroglobulin n=1 Tax=Carettochelys insculpta TaxID=44489 RepID=UPI003EB7677B
MGPVLLSILFCFVSVVSANIFEYEAEAQPLRPCELQREKAFLEGGIYIPQCLEDGQFRTVQCSTNGRSCWCVDANGIEVPGSKQMGVPTACLSFCQLQKQEILVSHYINSSTLSYVPQCLNSGEFDPVQCDVGPGQCWCVDSEGMEIYGTRQMGKPMQCPGSCEIRDRRILHGVGERSPPQCSADGKFLPVQCKFVNMTDMMVFDLVHTYNRFPDAFQTFSSFRSTFPEVSGYCYCADSLGRELAETGLELLLEEVYDTIFTTLQPAHTFAETSIYRILQRRFLGVQLATSGRFRCPSKCEVERFAAFRFRHAYKPSCEENGDYTPVQCEQDGLCWCVDPKGQEIQGTRRQDQPLVCGEERACASERRQALSRLFYGPVGHFSQHNVFDPLDITSERTARFSSSCLPSFKELFVDSGLLAPITEKQDASQLLALEAIFSDAIRGMFLSRQLARVALQFTTNPKRFQENLFGGKFLKNLIQFNFTGALGTRGNFRIDQFFQREGIRGMDNSGGFAEELLLETSKGSFNLSQLLVDSFGRTVSLQDNQKAVEFLVSVLELPEFFAFLQHVIAVPENIAEDLGEVVKIAFKSKDCTEQPWDLFVPTCTKEGRYEEIQCYAGACWCMDSQGKEVPGSRVLGKRPRCPTACEKQRTSLQSLKQSQPAGSDLFVPSCTKEGDFLPVQCHGNSCICVDLEGRVIPGTTRKAGEPMQCPSACQITAAQVFLKTVRLLLSDPSALSQLSSVYIPQCSSNGAWRQVQCNGPPEQAFEWYQRWITQNNKGETLPVTDLLNILLEYKESSSQGFAAFIKGLYASGHQKIFPALAEYSSFDALPPGALEGNGTTVSENILLEPYTFWLLLHGQLTHYPGAYADFSAPLGHFELRNCWCVDSQGEELQGTKAELNKIPACPGACERVKQEAMKFMDEAEQLILASNGSHIPVGQSFLMAKGLQLTDDDLLRFAETFQSGAAFSEKLLMGSNYAVQLAAQSTLHFYWRNHFTSRGSAGQATLLGFHPYFPQCDGLGNWEPVQCYESTGHCWCVDERGRYITESLVIRSAQLPECQTSCQRSRANELISSWRQRGSDLSATGADLFIPSCLETGEYTVLQKSDTDAWCVDPTSGTIVQRSTKDSDGSSQCPGFCSMLKSKVILREIGTGYIPQCEGDNGNFSPVQCNQDGESCWCIFANGEEVPGTQVRGRRPACDSPQCLLPFNASYVINGALFCADVSDQNHSFQQCQLVCHQGFQSAFSSATFLCDRESRHWISEPPLPQSCQKLQLFQTVQAQTHFELLLPSEKTCSSDYTGLLQAFQIFILDELKALGFCHIQVNAFGDTGSVSVCDDSSVLVECSSVDRLRVNITWKAQLDGIPAAALPDLHDIEKAMVGENLIGRFVALIEGGGFVLHLDSKQFPADTSIHFPRDEDFDLSPSVQLGCQSGFRRSLSPGRAIPHSQGCVVCPAGSYSQNDECIQCPAGSYQLQTGSSSCIRCPVGKTTISMGAFRADHCVTDCQRNRLGLRCSEDGQYRPSQADPTTQKSFCVDHLGMTLDWTETDSSWTDSQCLVLRKFERIPESKLIYSAEDARILRSETIQGDPQSALLQCISDCETDESCGFVTVSAPGSEVLCELHSAAETNFNCTTSGLMRGVMGNPAAISIAQLNCLFKVRNQQKDEVMVYLKKGQEFTVSGLKTFEMTDFQNVLTGVYSSVVVSAAGVSLTEAHLFCRQTCSQDPCCDGFILSQVKLDRGTILCGLMSYPDVLICHRNDWNQTSKLAGDGICKGVNYDAKKQEFTFSLGGQEFTGISELSEEREGTFRSIQWVYLWRESDMITRMKSSACGTAVSQTQTERMLPDSVMELFSLMDNSLIQLDQNRSLPSQQYWLFKPQYSAEQAMLWCLARCVAEDTFCQLAALQNTTDTHLACTLYPEAQICDNYINHIPETCQTVLPQQPQMVYHKRVALEGTVKNFYTRLPFRKVTGVSVRNKIDMSGKAISDGFFECERQCDSDPCCTGFGLLNKSQSRGAEVLCMTLNSLGIQTCSEDMGSTWQLSDCSSADVQIYPFGWYQKPATMRTVMPSVCPPVLLPSSPENVPLDTWVFLDASSVLIEPSILNFDIAQVSREISDGFSASREFCLSVCSKSQSCAVSTLEIQPSAIRCLFYPDTKICTHNLQGHSCRVLLKEPATYIYLKQDSFSPLSETDLTSSVNIPSHGILIGRAQVVRVGSEWRNVSQFLGIPYAVPPVAENRFHPPEPFTWLQSWNATVLRDSCWQPGDGLLQSSPVSEDCLYLNVFVPARIGRNMSVLLFFHNGVSGEREKGRTVIDGSYLASVSDVIVVTAGYRVGVFGFLSTGSPLARGNWGLLDQLATLKWVQKNIASFGGDPSQISIAADRSGADVSSIHLLAGAADLNLFKGALLMGGSAFSPVSVISKKKAQDQVAALANEFRCPSTSSEETVSCLRQVPAKALNDAQTRLLALSGPFQYWGPVVDGVYLREPLAAALQRSQLGKVDLLIGTAQQDGLISRAKAIKKFEESQGRANSKTAFYQALQNSLGGEDSNAFIEDAATWYYSLQHSTADYASFSRALENATRDHFITCPIISMAKHWADHSIGNVFMYHVPESASQSSSSLELLPDVQYAFGLPFYPQYEERFTLEEKRLSLKIMQYIGNFIKSGNPNYPHNFSRKLTGALSPWPMFLPHTNGDNYKEFIVSLPNRKGLKKAECSFWSDYIKVLKASTSKTTNGEQSMESSPTEEPAAVFNSEDTQSQSVEEKVAYSK